MGRFFVGIGAAAGRWRNGIVGEHLANEASLHGGTTRKAKAVRQERATGYHVGDLAAARDDFAEATSLAVIWDGGVAGDGFDDE